LRKRPVLFGLGRGNVLRATENKEIQAAEDGQTEFHIAPPLRNAHHAVRPSAEGGKPGWKGWVERNG